MSDWFQVTMPGDPPSWNHMYRWTTSMVPDGAGGRRPQRIQVKEKGVELYQAQLTMITRTAKPTGFAPAGQIIVAYSLFLVGNKDADNVLKACNDAVAAGLGVNDKRFLPVVLRKETRVKEPQVVIGIFDAEKYHLSVVAK